MRNKTLATANHVKIQRGNFSSLEESHLYAPACRVVEREKITSSWAPSISLLIAAGYSFLSSRFTEEGFLFRGMESGIMDAIANGSFGHFDGSREESGVEQVMDICFLTHEIRDALTVAEMENDRDGGILVIPSAHFNQSLDKKTAAFLAIGDSGMVFHYPFLTEEIPLDEIFLLVVTESLAKKLIASNPEVCEKLLVLTPCADNSNEEILRQLLLDRGIKPANLVPDKVKPRRSDLVLS